MCVWKSGMNIKPNSNTWVLTLPPLPTKWPCSVYFWPRRAVHVQVAGQTCDPVRLGTLIGGGGNTVARLWHLPGHNKVQGSQRFQDRTRRGRRGGEAGAWRWESLLCSLDSLLPLLLVTQNGDDASSTGWWGRVSDIMEMVLCRRKMLCNILLAKGVVT